MAGSQAQVIEAFHLAFLEVLRKKLDPTRYVLKGGANLRYFFDSARYSEDIDIDVSGIPGWALEEKVDGVLRSPALAITLRSSRLGIAVGEASKPKQTDTTRRWKVSLSAAGQSEPVRTKIEFSNRNGEGRHILEAVAARVVAPYGLRPPSVQHYLAEPAAEQKILALAGRSETQARDVYDLDLLLRRAPSAGKALEADMRRAAAERALELPYAAFADQVLPFLDSEVADLYDDTSWQTMRLLVTEQLLGEER